MPFVKTGANNYKSPSGRNFTKKQVKMYYATNGFTKKKVPIVAKKLKGSFGETTIQKGKAVKVEIDVKRHKSKKELADTIHHELMHAQHPKMHEKTVYKRTAKDMKVMSQSEQDALVAKVRHKKLNYTLGAVKRKLKVSGDFKPGELITKAKSQKVAKNNGKSSISHETKVTIMGAM